MYRKIILILVLCCGCILSGTPAFAAGDPDSTVSPPQIMHTNRISGQTRYETAKKISEFYDHGKVKNVILATGKDFADALSASVLAHEKEAPILLADSSVNNSLDAFDYITQHLDLDGTVYIIGGVEAIGAEFESKLYDLGFKNVVRIAGTDRYDTSYKIAGSLSDIKMPSVVISSGEQYPDALSISGFAAHSGWPILLSPHDALPQEMKDFLLQKKPSKVYITGGEGAISENVEKELTSLLPQTAVERFKGQSRFDTNIIIAQTFAPNPSTVYLTTGCNFADALAGSILAAQNGDPIIFIDPLFSTLPKATAGYFANFCAKNWKPGIISFGGSGVVPEEVIKNSEDLISGTAKETNIYSAEDITASVFQDEDYSLPATDRALLYNSDWVDVPVQWNTKAADTSTIGEKVYEGVINGYQKTVKLRLTVKEPIPLAQYTTYFDPNFINRTENIRLAAKALDGKLLAPGERFSFNKSVGERTVEKGYKEAIIIEGNSFVPGLGGGVCQVSSTLYNAAVLANLEILERHHHTLHIDYVPSGQDATVSFPELDLKFRNNTDKYLLIRSFLNNNALTFKLYKKLKK
jgi:putative cell wall-binding protein